jgi:hypothetical protein
MKLTGLEGSSSWPREPTIYHYSPRNELRRYSGPEGPASYSLLQYDMRANLTRKKAWSAARLPAIR